MGRLIDADALKNYLYRNRVFAIVTNSEGKNVLEIIDEQPTAYDVEKVVEEVSTHAYIMGFDKSEVGLLVDDIRNGGKE